MSDAATAAPGAAPAAPPATDRVLQLYRHAGDIEVALEGASQRDAGALLTPAQVGAYNAIFRTARELFPNSVALREDAFEVDEKAGARAADVYRALRVGVLPTLHNALPEELQSRR